jgi:hypothetical protein
MLKVKQPVDGLTINNEQEESNLYYMQDVVDQISKFQIRGFNWLVFEEDLDNMYKTEFNNFFNDYIKKMVEDLNMYLAIDIADIENEPYRIKLAFVKNIARFVMNTLPYIYMKEYLEKENVEGLHDALEQLSDNTQQKICDQIENSQKQYQSFNTMMTDIEDTITNEKKKNKVSDMLNLLDASMDNKSKLLDYYKSIIQNSGSENLKKLFKIYLTEDLQNIL